MSELPTGTVTFLFTDLEGSTELLRRLRDEYGDALSTHQRLMREAIGRHGGVEIDTQGDAFFFAFQRASDAVEAAIAAQRALAEHEWPEGERTKNAPALSPTHPWKPLTRPWIDQASAPCEGFY